MAIRNEDKQPAYGNLHLYLYTITALRNVMGVGKCFQI